MAATKLRLYRDALRHLADARLDLITDDVESRYALDDAWAEAVDFVLRLAAWRFALKSAALVATTGPLSGYAAVYARPGDWLRTHAIFQLGTTGRECPLDLREQGLKISANPIATGAIIIRYVSADYADPALALNPWPEHFAQLVAAYLAFLVAARVTGERSATGRMSELFSSLLPAALAMDAVPEDLWLPHQRDGALTRALHHIMRLENWRFAIKEATLAAAAGGTSALGFLYVFAQPADWLRTAKLFVIASNPTREVPLDAREQAGYWSAQVSSILVKYVSSTLAFDATKWPGPVYQAILSYLASGGEAAEEAGEKAGAQKSGAAWERDLAIAQRDWADPDDPWLRYQLDGTFARVAEALGREHFWRHAGQSQLIATTANAGPGRFTRQAALPTALWRTQALYVLAPSGERRPFDVTEQAGVWYTDALSFWVDFSSATLALDATHWSPQFEQAVRLALPLAPGAGQNAELDIALAKAALAAAYQSDATPEDPWLGYQLDGSFARAARAVILEGFWKQHLKTLQIDLSTQLADEAMAGLPYRFALPGDWLMTHALYVPRDGLEAPFNIRESAEDWSTDTPLFAARYLSTSALDPATWPEPVARAVLAFLEWQVEPVSDAGDKAASVRAPAYRALVGEALRLYSLPPSNWLRFQLDGSFKPAVLQVLEKGRWRFAIRTETIAANTDPTAISDGTVSTGYAYRFLKPSDWLRTIWVHYQRSSGLYGERSDIDFRDEEDAIHANWSPITLRYLRRSGLDATRWPANFSDAVLALLEHLEMRADPTKAAAAKLKLDFYERQCSLAETLDDTNEVPRINNVGRFVAARYGRRGHGGAGGGTGGATPSSTTILTDEASGFLTDESSP